MSDDTITDAALAKSFAQESDDPWLVFLTITHASIDGGVIYLVQNTVDVVRTIGGEAVTFNRAAFEYEPPQAGEENTAVGRIRVPNAAREIIGGLRKLQGTDTATALIEVALATDPDTPQQMPIELDLDAITWDAGVVEGRLSAGALNSAWPWLTFDNASFPGQYPG